MPRSGRPDDVALQLSLFDQPPVLPVPRAAAPPLPQGAAMPPAVVIPHATVPHFQHPRAQRSIALAGHQVGYAFRRARRRSIGFVVGADGLSVSAPRWVAVAEVEQALQAKAAWILCKLHEQQERARRLQAA